MPNAVGAVIALQEPSSTLRQRFLRAFREINAQRRFVLLSPGTLCQHGCPPSLVSPGTLRPPRGCPIQELLQAASRRVPTAQPGPKRTGSFWGWGCQRGAETKSSCRAQLGPPPHSSQRPHKLGLGFQSRMG